MHAGSDIPHYDCHRRDCWTRIKHFCICVRTVSTCDELGVYINDVELRCIYDQVGASTGMTWRQFQDAVQAEADNAARASLPAIHIANEALGSLGNDQTLLTIRFCIRIGPIRICVEWLL